MRTKSRPVIPSFSFLIPTRGRPRQLERMLSSVRTMTADLDDVEIVLCLDEDDEVGLEALANEIDTTPFRLKQVVIPPGQTMGRLNNACFEASTGRYIMAMNDDVVLRTPGWDEELRNVFDSFEDGIALLHVNDMLFQERLCTFPLVSRVFCELYGSFCPDVYQRYRIDDHVYDIFNLLAYLGYPRIQYFPEVVFEHFNFEIGSDGKRDYKSYTPNPKILEVDAEAFEELRWRRKEFALRLVEHIEETRVERLMAMGSDRLAGVQDTHSYRRPDFVRVRSRSDRLSSANTRVTVGVVSADIRAPHARKCLSNVKRYTENYDLIILDNNGGPGFNHSREMNRILRTARTDHLVLLDDDIFVGEGWLDGMLAEMTPETGLVTPVHLNAKHEISYAGVGFLGDGTGRHAHIIDVPPKARPTPTICSAAMLLDLQKCGGIRPNELFEKYFMDLDLGLRFWESGYQTLLAPDVHVVHIGGATLEQGSAESDARFERDRLRFVTEWIDSGRLQAIEEGIWSQYPYLRWYLQLQREVMAFLRTVDDGEIESFGSLRPVITSLLSRIGTVEVFVWDVLSAIGRILHEELCPLTPDDKAFLQQAIGQLQAGEVFHRVPTAGPGRAGRTTAAFPRAPLVKTIETDHQGFEIVLFGEEFVAVPAAEGPFTQAGLAGGRYSRVLRHPEMAELKGMLAAASRVTPTPAPPSPAALPEPEPEPVSKEVRLIEPDYRGFRISLLEHKYYAVPAEAGEFSFERFRAGEYPECHVGDSLLEVKGLVNTAENADLQDGNTLMFAHLPPERMAPFLDGVEPESNLTLLTPKANAGHYSGYDLQTVKGPADDPGLFTQERLPRKLLNRLRKGGFDTVVVPHTPGESWKYNGVEALAGTICDRVQVRYVDGSHLEFANESLHRLMYNTAYLRSMFSAVPSIQGKRVLEVGCSDGLVCRMLVGEQPEAIDGVDVLETAGSLYPHERIRYQPMAGESLDFPDDSFDLTYSIATMEHVRDPFRVLSEMKRVTRPGGYCYAQAGPLYHSPFGHHMFAYFQDLPWVHLRMSEEEILEYCEQNEIDDLIRRDLGVSASEYLSNMLCPEHINGLRLHEYRLEEFKALPDVEVLRSNVSREGEDLLTDTIRNELVGYDDDVLTAHGFELIFRVN